MRRRKQNRLEGYDYRQGGLYFITSCVSKKECLLGEIWEGIMYPSAAGEIADKQFLWLEEHFEYLKVDEYVIMPNHFHAIILIDPSSPPLLKIKPLSDLIGAYKMTTSKAIHAIDNGYFSWQRSFHDHIIRDEVEYRKIKNYIISNPRNWKDDMFYK
ncbi:MAG: transposase [Bacteroidetes bacterium]|nr:transposase [Bacteroidota bacterium]